MVETEIVFKRRRKRVDGQLWWIVEFRSFDLFLYHFGVSGVLSPDQVLAALRHRVQCSCLIETIEFTTPFMDCIEGYRLYLASQNDFMFLKLLGKDILSPP